METINILNVTALEPRLKHPRIFELFDSLAPGAAFIIDNDHDPKPLYYQLLAERGQVFSWEYYENGPELWKVKISKTIGDTQTETIGEIVNKDYRKAQVFKRYGIDFCCGGKKTIAEVCKTKGIDVTKLEKDLSVLSDEVYSSENDYLKWDTNFLVDYIINTHHRYVKDNTVFIKELANKVAKVHGAQHPEAIEIASIFSEVADDLLLHLEKEEKILFPFIKELIRVEADGSVLPESLLGNVTNPIQMMEAEHEQVGEALQMIRDITQNFALPADACNSYMILYKKLDEYENDLHRHVHLENNVLFPKAIDLQAKLN
ncbi:iron-sulfur cluster repair di-iron protein [Pedobacter sp. JCM 36344]|uniref:iron-sulfur cluster repair di-iron protein n=1 Tax=Pedobacter sp. JCM 36344 TaxID=3374280 RepID=UPI0039782FBD